MYLPSESEDNTMRKISYAQAGMEALVEEMRRDPTTFHLSTDAPDALVKEFWV